MFNSIFTDGVSREIRKIEQNRESNLRLESAKKVEELVSEPTIMQYWRIKVSSTSKRPEVTNIKRSDEVWKEWLHNFNPETHIDVLYTLLAICHDDYLHINPIFDEPLKKHLTNFYEPYIYYRKTKFLDIYLSYILRDLTRAKLIGKKEENKMETHESNIKASKENWEVIKKEYGISRPEFGKKINFVKDPFKKKVIFRDIEHAFVLASQGFSKPAIILAGGVIEELLRLYLEHKKVKPERDDFFHYIKACEDKGLIKRGVLRLSDSVRDFRNLVHLAEETEKKHTITTATAKGAVSSIFTIADNF